MIFISEVGMNYNNNFNLCYELIRQSKLSGANIVKFQLGWRDGKDEINNIDEAKISQLYKWASYFEIDLMFSVLKKESLDLIKKFKPNRIKVASKTLKEDLNLAEQIVNLKIETFMSLGMWDDKENLPFKEKNIKYLWCKSEYPTFIEHLKGFPKNFEYPIVGYSDHCIGIEACLIAISRGAKIIEKHFTLDKSENIIRDHALSATPEEFRQLVNLGVDIEKKINLDL